MADVTLNGQPAIQANLNLVMNGAWSAELQVGTEDVPAVGATVTLAFLDVSLTGRVVRSGSFAQRVSLRLTGGATEWTEAVGAKHYREATIDSVLTDLGLTLDQSNTEKLPFWSRQQGTRGQAVQELAQRLGFNWRVNPDGTLRMRAEAPTSVTVDAVEVDRDDARGIVTLALNTQAGVLPGTTYKEDSVGDVLFDMDEKNPLRCRYYTESRARIRDGLAKVIRWVMRDSIYFGKFTAKVERQAADLTLDLTADDPRLRGTGLQSVPIRHGLPGVEVEVPVGEQVLLGFDGGDPRKPYASLWHSGQVTAVRIGGARAVAMADLVSERIDAIQQAFDAHIHPTGVGPSGPPQEPIGPLDPVESEVVFTR